MEDHFCNSRRVCDGVRYCHGCRTLKIDYAPLRSTADVWRELQGADFAIAIGTQIGMKVADAVRYGIDLDEVSGIAFVD